MPNIFLTTPACGKRAVFWCLAFFLVSQLALGFYLHRRRPELRDPVYGDRIRLLKEKRAADPNSPLVLIVGSSRAMNGLSPAALPEWASRFGPKPMIYNFALSGSGSMRVLMMFRRIIAAGVRPDYLLIETWPPMWAEAGGFDEKQIIAQDDLHWSDVPLLCRHLPNKADILARTLRGSMVPVVSYRGRLLYAAAQFLLPREQAWQTANELSNWHSFDGTGWVPVLKEPATIEEWRAEVARGQFVVEPLLNPLHIHPSSDRALRDLLEECRILGIKTALLLMPEHSECRRWYSAQARSLVSRYLDGISREYQVPVIDTRDWLSDEQFSDCCHMAKRAAAPFSRRFGREALYPWLTGFSRDP
jgi:hypothetical protein